MCPPRNLSHMQRMMKNEEETIAHTHTQTNTRAQTNKHAVPCYAASN